MRTVIHTSRSKVENGIGLQFGEDGRKLVFSAKVAFPYRKTGPGNGPTGEDVHLRAERCAKLQHMGADEAGSSRQEHATSADGSRKVHRVCFARGINGLGHVAIGVSCLSENDSTVR